MNTFTFDPEKGTATMRLYKEAVQGSPSPSVFITIQISDFENKTIGEVRRQARLAAADFLQETIEALRQ